MLLYILDIDVACYHYEGIDAVKAALKAGLEVSSEEMPVKVCSKQFCIYCQVHIIEGVGYGMFTCCKKKSWFEPLLYWFRVYEHSMPLSQPFSLQK